MRPPDPDATDETQWGDYLFARSNPKGVHRELWFCEGCRHWFQVARDTLTHVVHEIYTIVDHDPAARKP